MGMGYELPKPKSKWETLPFPLIAQALSVIVGIICFGLALQTVFVDEVWNHKMTALKGVDYYYNQTIGKGNVTKAELRNLLIRDSWMKKAFCLLIAFTTMMATIHIFIYILFKKEVYRYKFTIWFNSFLSAITIVAAIFLLITTLQNDHNYGEIFKLLRDHKIKDDLKNPRTLYAFRFCQVNTGSRDEDQLPDIPRRFQQAVLHGTMCQMFYTKIIATLLAALNLAFYSIVMLTVKSTREDIKKAIDHAKDLDVEPWMWTDPHGTLEFITQYIYHQDRAKHILKEIDEGQVIPDHAAKQYDADNSRSLYYSVGTRVNT